MHRKMLSYFVALAVATGAFLAHAEIVGEDVARAAAEGFLAKSSVAKRIFAGREVSSVEERGNLWIARLSPSGHVIIAGSDKCYPIVSFSAEDFAEPEADSPFAEKLSSDSLRVAEKEADATSEVDGAWAKLTASVIKKRVLLAANPHSADSDEYLAPFIGAAWSQGSPMNSFTPRNAVCGCTATAGGQELRYWRWPYRFEKSRTTTHVLYDASNNTSLYAIRMDGRVPFNYDKITDRAGTVAWLAADKEVPYNTAYLTSWVQSMVIVDFKPGAASGNKKLNEYADQYWYEKGTTMSRSRDGYTNLWNAIKADLDWGSPIQINTHNHQMVVVGYAVDNAGTDDEVDWVNVNFGWGRDANNEWYNLANETEEGKTTTDAHTFADFQIGYHPQKIVQFEPVPKVSKATVPLTWHIAPCYTNRIDGFDLDVVKLGEQTTFNDDFSASTGTVESPGNNFKIENGYLGGYPVANQTSTYTYPEEFHISESSVLSFNAKSRYMGAYYSDSGTHTATVEVFPNNGPWETLDTIPLSGRSSWLIADKAIDLSVYAGKTIKLRFKFVTGAPTVGAGSSADFIIDNVAVTNIRYADETTYSTSIEKAADMPSVYSYDVTGLDDGCAYAFNVTPVMSDGADALTNFTTTRIGTPNPAPSIDNVSSIACGLELVQQGFYIECAREIINDIVVTCNESTTELLAYPSHISALPDEKVSVTKDGNVFTVRLDARGMQNVWDGDMMLLTLVAKNADGTEASKNLMLRFNSMRQVLDGTFDVVEADADSAVWFCGTTTIDAKGEDVVFAPGVFMGTGNITLTDTVGGGSFTFQGLDGFTGTIIFNDSVNVIFAGDTLETLQGLASRVVQNGGTLTVKLTEYQIAYGCSIHFPQYKSGTIQFVDKDGNAIAHNESDGTCLIGASAKTWTAAYSDFYNETSCWLGGNVADASDEYVCFDLSGNTTVYLEDDISLNYVKVQGTGTLKFEDFFNSGAKVSIQTLENETPFVVNGDVSSIGEFRPSSDVVLATGIQLDRELGWDVARFIKKEVADNTYESALGDSAYWRGTVVFSGYAAEGENLNDCGNAQSIVRLNGVSGYLADNATFNPTVELVDNGATPALDWNNGSDSSTATFTKICGTGTFKTSGSSATDEKIIVNNIDVFIGSFDLASKTVAIGTDSGTAATNGRLNFNLGYGATIARGKIWTIGGGLYLAGNQTLTVNGTLDDSGTITAEGTDTTLALASTAHVRADSLLIANNTLRLSITQDASPTLSVAGAATLTGATIELDIDDGTTIGDSVLLMSAGSFEGANSATLSGVEGYDLEVSGGKLYAVKHVEVDSPNAAAVWDGDFAATADGYTLTDWQQTHGENMGSVTIDRANQGLFVDFTAAKGYFTVLVKYTNLVASSSNKRVLFATTANSDYTRDRCGIRLLTDGKVQGLWNASKSANNDADYDPVSTGTVPSAGTLAFVYDKDTSGTSAYIAGTGESLPSTALWNNTALKAGDMYGFAVGGMCREAAVNGVEAAQGMTISGMAVFDKVLSVAEMNAYEWPSEAPAYEGPAPIAVWVAGEFDDDRSAHGGLEFALNGNTTNALGQIVIGNATTLGATVAIPSGTLPRMTMLVKYSVPAGGAPVAQSVPASLFSTYDMGARVAQSGSSSLDGYWLNGSSITTGYAFSSPAQTMPQDGYILVSNWTTTPNSGDHGTAVYSGETLSTLVGGEKTGLRFTGANNYITSIGVGGPTVAGAKPWAGMVIKGVALFDEWVATNVIANYKFPAQGAVQPEDSDRYVVEPVASWVNDFKTLTKGDYTLSISGTTAAKDDTFGGTLTIGNAAAIIDTTAASNTTLTVLIKYRAASSVVSAPVVAFGGMAAVGLDVGVYTKSDKTLAVYRNFSTDNTKPYDFGTAPQLSATGGYVLCARDNGQQCMAYVGDSLDAMTGGTVSDGGIKFSNITLTKLGIGGNSGMAANANDMVPFAGLEIEKIVVFDGYYTPDQIRYVENPEDGDTVNIASGATWNFAAGETRTYTSVGTLSSGGTIAITNASTLVEGTYKLAEWTTPQQYTTQCAGYGKVGTLVTDGLAAGLSARLIYGARGIYLRVDDTAKQAARKPLVVWCYGDSITEGFNAQATGANYRILLYQKLEMLGYNVRSTGVYGLSNGYNSVDPTGTPLTDQYKWHSAKHGATAGPTTLAHRSNLSENVDTLAIQAGTPDVALLLIGVNDIPEWKSESDRVTPVFKAWTNVVSRMVKNLPDTKIVVSTILYSDGTRTDIDPTITAVNTQIKNLLDNLPAEWQGHVFLADLNSYVKSGETGIIYNDHLHPDWWGYDQMADGYLDAIVKCYPDPDATDFPSQNPIPAAPTADQLGAANKPELADYRAGFTKLCNIRVEKGQDVNNVVYDDVNNDAASDNLEKVGYFVEFVRDDNHAHKWVWVDMDAFGDADLASVGLPTTNRQQAVTRMHVCSNHGAIDNVAADDDSVTGWIEFSPYDYTRTASNSAAPANYGEPFDWNDTLSESGSYGCMQVFRVMNPSSRDLYERPQLMFAFNNFQSANSNPADFGIGNFAQHFNCNNAYHTEDWTGVGGTLAKMAPDQYSVKTIEIWTKEAAYSGPAPAAVWVAGEFDDDKSAHGGLDISLNGNTTNTLGQIVIGDDATIGATIKLPDDTFAKASILVKYELASGSSPVANAAPIGVVSTDGYPIIPICETKDGTILKGAYLNKDNSYALATNSGNYWPFSSTPTISNGEGYMLLSYHSELANPMSHGTAVYVGSSVNTLSGGNASNLQWKSKTIDKIAIGGPTTAGGANPWKGMVIKGVALFTDEWLTPTDLANYTFPAQGAVQPVDTDSYLIEPVASWVNDFKTTKKGDYTLSVSGTTAVKDDTFGGTLTIGNAAAVIDIPEPTRQYTMLIKYSSAPAQAAQKLFAGGSFTNGESKVDIGLLSTSASSSALIAGYDNGSSVTTKDLGSNVTPSTTGGYILIAHDAGSNLSVYAGDTFNELANTSATIDYKFSSWYYTSLAIGGPSGVVTANKIGAWEGLVVEKIAIFNGYYMLDQICDIPNPEDGDTLAIGNGKTWRFAAGTTRTYTNIGTLNAGGTIAITNASELAEGTYTLATWTTAQKLSKGYGHVGTLDVTGLPAGLSAELVYGAKAIYLRVWNPTAQAEKGTIRIWPYGDSITEGYNSSGTTANYRVLLAQKLSMLGFNVEMVGCYDKANGANAIDPAGQLVPDNWKWHSAKHGATAGPTTNYNRGNLCENVDTLAAQACNPDVVLLHIGVNDLAESSQDQNTTFNSLTNVVQHLIDDLPNSKIVVSTALRQLEPARTVQNVEIDAYNGLIRGFMADIPAAWSGHVLFADLATFVDSQGYGIICTDNVHPDWWGHDQMAEGWLSVVTNQFSVSDTFNASVGPAVDQDKLGAANKPELADYRNGFKRYGVINVPDGAVNLDPANYTYSDVDSTAAASGIERVGYFVEYVRKDNNAHKWVWVDMDAFDTTIAGLGLPSEAHQVVVNNLHVKSNHNGIDDVAFDDNSVKGFVEFSPFSYSGEQSSVPGAPTGNSSSCDWNDTLGSSGNYSCMQVHRIAPASGRGGQVLFAFNNWHGFDSNPPEFGVGNFSQHFYTTAAQACTLDYTFTRTFSKINADAYSVKRIEIWTKPAGGYEPEEKYTNTDYPVPYSWFSEYYPGIEDYPDMVETFAKMPASNGQNNWWQCYVLGLVPTNETSKFTVSIRMDGTTPIVEYSPTNDTIAIQYILLGKPVLSNDWQEVEFDEPGDTNRFFGVKVKW